MSTTERHLAPISTYARHRGVSVRTARSWVAEGYVTAYRLPGVQAALIDFDEADDALAALPPTVIRRNFGSLGANARVVRLGGAE